MAPHAGAAAEGAGSDTGTGPLVLSASQLNRFATCETAWLLDRQHPRDEGGPKPDYFLVGEGVHRCIQAWAVGRPWQPALDAALAEADPHWTADFEPPEWYAKVATIMEAWVRDRGAAPDTPWVAVELPFDLEIPGAGGARIRGFLDGMRRVPGPDANPNHDTRRVVEIKTMGRWGRERRAPFASDTWLYLWAARSLIPGVTGLDFEAISTYPSKSADYERLRPLAIEYDPRFEARMLEDLRRTAKRASAIVKNPALAVRSVGEACDRCAHQQRCLRPWEVS